MSQNKSTEDKHAKIFNHEKRDKKLRKQANQYVQNVEHKIAQNHDGIRLKLNCIQETQDQLFCLNRNVEAIIQWINEQIQLAMHKNTKYFNQQIEKKTLHLKLNKQVVPQGQNSSKDNHYNDLSYSVMNPIINLNSQPDNNYKPYSSLIRDNVIHVTMQKANKLFQDLLSTLNKKYERAESEILKVRQDIQYLSDDKDKQMILITTIDQIEKDFMQTQKDEEQKLKDIQLQFQPEIKDIFNVYNKIHNIIIDSDGDLEEDLFLFLTKVLSLKNPAPYELNEMATSNSLMENSFHLEMIINDLEQEVKRFDMNDYKSSPTLSTIDPQDQKEEQLLQPQYNVNQLMRQDQFNTEIVNKSPQNLNSIKNAKTNQKESLTQPSFSPIQTKQGHDNQQSTNQSQRKIKRICPQSQNNQSYEQSINSQRSFDDTRKLEVQDNTNVNDTSVQILQQNLPQPTISESYPQNKQKISPSKSKISIAINKSNQQPIIIQEANQSNNQQLTQNQIIGNDSSQESQVINVVNQCKKCQKQIDNIYQQAFASCGCVYHNQCLQDHFLQQKTCICSKKIGWNHLSIMMDKDKIKQILQDQISKIIIKEYLQKCPTNNCEFHYQVNIRLGLFFQCPSCKVQIKAKKVQIQQEKVEEIEKNKKVIQQNYEQQMNEQSLRQTQSQHITRPSK